MAGFIDTSGAFVGIWEAREHIGAEVVNEPGSVGWNDLMTRDTAAAEAFYPAVFGIEAAPWENAGLQYTVWNVDGRSETELLDLRSGHVEPVPAAPGDVTSMQRPAPCTRRSL